MGAENGRILVLFIAVEAILSRRKLFWVAGDWDIEYLTQNSRDTLIPKLEG